jgi:transcriptional regulator with XRE-family HTH domain
MSADETFPMSDPAYAAVYAEEAAMVDASELIAEAMKQANVSSAELARKLHVSRSEVSARLGGDRNITVRKLAATLHTLNRQLVIGARPTSEHTFQVFEHAAQTVTVTPPNKWTPLPLASDSVAV